MVNASSEPEHLAVNGMSYSQRDGVNANSAIVVSVTPDDFEDRSPLGGIEFQRKLEEAAYREGNSGLCQRRYGIVRCGKPDFFSVEDSAERKSGKQLLRNISLRGRRRVCRRNHICGYGWYPGL